MLKQPKMSNDFNQLRHIFRIFAKTIVEGGGMLMSTKKETQEIKKTAEMKNGSNVSVNSMPSIWYT